MDQVSISVDKNYVILSFSSRGRDLTLAPAVAERVGEVGLQMCAEAEAWEKSGGQKHVIEGKDMSCSRPMSWDGRVNVRFSEFTDRVKMPWQAAKVLFEEMKAKAVEAWHNMTIVDRRRATTAGGV